MEGFKTVTRDLGSETDLASRRVRDYLDLLGSDSPAPGGGSAAALCAATGAALLEMVCAINAKRKTASDPSASRAGRAAAARVRSELLPLVTKDAEAYRKIAAEWTKKSPELVRFLEEGSRIPLAIAELSAEALAVAGAEKERTSPHLVGDLFEAALILEAAAKSAFFHVEGNLAMLEKTAAAPIRERMTAVAESIRPLVAGLRIPERSP